MHRRTSTQKGIRLTDEDLSFLLCLWHLRYLSSDQIHPRWYGDRTLKGARDRLYKLRRAGFIESSRYGATAFAWRTAPGALPTLREYFLREFRDHDSVGAQWLPHLLATNDVWLTLSGNEQRWQALSFHWLGSHRAGIDFVATEFVDGFPKKRARHLRADAIVVPKGRSDALRVFLEVDRGTESIRSRTRTSIERKLKRYKSFLAPPPGKKTAYRDRFGDERRARIVFVVPASRRHVNGRRASILALAKEPNYRCLDVRCVAQDDVHALRTACGLQDARPFPSGATPHAANDDAESETNTKTVTDAASVSAAITDAHYSQLLVLLRASVEGVRVLRRVNPDMAMKLRAAALEARQALQAMKAGSLKRPAEARDGAIGEIPRIPSTKSNANR